jgi:hypothetical protein
VNRSGSLGDTPKVQEMCREDDLFFRGFRLPANLEVIHSEPVVTPLLSRDSDFMHEIKSLAVTITHPCEVRSPKFL